MQINIHHPFKIDGRGRVAQAGIDDHVRQLIEQVLFTRPGERVNRPNFGSGIYQLVFAPNNEELEAASRFLVEGALEQWLGNVIEVEAIAIKTLDSRLQVTIQYVLRENQERQIAQFVREV